MTPIRFFALSLMAGFAAPTAAGAQSHWRPIVAVALDAAGAPARWRSDTAYFTGGLMLRGGIERWYGSRTAVRVAISVTGHDADTGNCATSLPPICQFPAHAVTGLATGLLHLRTLEVELGGGWGALRQKHPRATIRTWPANGPMAYTSASLGTPRVHGVRGFVEIRYGQWVMMRPVREFGGLTAGLQWR
jgi:hypothetical protein